MHPTFIHFFGIQITTYGLMMAVSFATLWLCTVHRGQKLGYSQDFIINLITIIVAGAFIFARFLHVIVEWDYYAQNPSAILFSRDGFVFLGGFVGATALAVWYTKKKQQSILGVADLFAPFLALAQGMGRIGCFLYGCCFGKVCSAPWAVHFPPDSPAYNFQFNQGLIDINAVSSLPVHPTQIYHSLFNFAHFGILLFIRSRQTFRGQLAMCYLMIYSLGRFVIEFYRGDSYRGIYGLLSTSQILSLLLFAVGAAGFFLLKKLALTPEAIGAIESCDSSTKPSDC
ncbi:MAG: prolipoprotein diacylglyceryl transferase [Candidatus Omnitrophica bacterium]|nr:prolipoprotein diacylglyceryl transferase [Candidatus Omnitrophota bacterium]